MKKQIVIRSSIVESIPVKNDYVYDDGGRHRYFRMKYKKDKQVGDCVVRALAIATKEDYKSVRSELWDISLKNGDMPNGNQTYEEFLEKRGFIKEKKIKGYCLGQYPVSHKEVYVVCLAKHLVCLDEGLVRDTWDCRRKYPYNTWKKPRD
tara:strand:+ start:106 stop:555 length:450 start_codon:yes stop_codon:yes gene_type:complete